MLLAEPLAEYTARGAWLAVLSFDLRILHHHVVCSRSFISTQLPQDDICCEGAPLSWDVEGSLPASGASCHLRTGL